MAFQNHNIELALAVASFIVASVLAFVGMAIHPTHDIAAGVCMTVAQFLLLCASLVGIDYKINSVGRSKPLQSLNQA